MKKRTVVAALSLISGIAKGSGCSGVARAMVIGMGSGCSSVAYFSNCKGQCCSGCSGDASGMVIGMGDSCSGVTSATVIRMGTAYIDITNSTVIFVERSSSDVTRFCTELTVLILVPDLAHNSLLQIICLVISHSNILFVV